MHINDLQIKQCKEGFQLISNDVKSTVSFYIGGANKNLHHFLELMLSQEVFYAR